MKTVFTTLKLLLSNIFLTLLFFLCCTYIGDLYYTGKNGFRAGLPCLLWSLIFFGLLAYWFRNDDKETRRAIYFNLALNLVVFTAITVEEYPQYHQFFD